MVSNYQLRQNARKQLGGNIFANNWLLMLAVFAVYSAIIGVGTVAALILSGPILYGIYRVMLDIVCSNKFKLETLLDGFKECFGNSLVLELLRKIFVLLWTLLFIIPGIVKAYAYSMAMCIQQEDPSMGASECLDESQKIMSGYKWQLFCLDCSFIGWYIVGALCFGIGVFFVTPYHQMARANFYLALKAKTDGE